MTTPRSELVDSDLPMYYHLVSRCVRQGMLCGYDKTTKKNYDHRKAWLENRMLHLAECFAIALHGYAVMSNHFHLAVYFDPNEADRWSNEEVVDRWLKAFPPTGELSEAELDSLLKLRRTKILGDPARIAHARATLGSLSMFMKYLKQPIARAANKEDGCSGHFFEKRFYSGALLTEDAVLAAMAYVDLNPVRAKIVQHVHDTEFTSLAHRLKVTTNNEDSLKSYIGPLACGITHVDPEVMRLPLTLEGYLDYLESLTKDSSTSETMTAIKTKWNKCVQAFRLRRRAYGSEESLTSWTARHGWRRSGPALP